MKLCEKVAENRNIVCHCPPHLENARWTFLASSVDKFLANYSSDGDMLKEHSIEESKAAIAKAETALTLGKELIDDLERFRAFVEANSASRRSSDPTQAN